MIAAMLEANQPTVLAPVDEEIQPCPECGAPGDRPCACASAT